MSRKHTRLFLAVLAASILLMAFQGRTGPIRPFGSASSPINYVNLLITDVGHRAGEGVRKITLRDEEVKALQREARLLRLSARRLQEIMLENERLRTALDLMDNEPRYVATARVISRGSDRWSNTFIVDKGRDDLVEKDMVVVVPEGLLGKVTEAGDSFSRVLLIDDPRFSVAVRLERSRTEAVVSGEGFGRLRVKYVGTGEAVEKGEAIVTSGLGGLFPQGIGVGFVAHVETDEEELFHDIEAVPFADTRKAEEVTIIRR